MIQQFYSWVFIWKKQTLIQKDTCSPMFTTALFIITKKWKQVKCPKTEEWINRMQEIYIYLSHTMEYHPALKKNET